MSKLITKPQITDYAKAKRCMSTFLLKRAELLEKVASQYGISPTLPTLRYLLFRLFERENPNMEADVIAAAGHWTGKWPPIEVQRFLYWIEQVPKGNLDSIRQDLAVLEANNGDTLRA